MVILEMKMLSILSHANNRNTDSLLWIPKYGPTDDQYISNIADHLQVQAPILRGHINIDPALPSTHSYSLT